MDFGMGEHAQVELLDGRVEFALGDLVAEEERIGDPRGHSLCALGCVSSGLQIKGLLS